MKKMTETCGCCEGVEIVTPQPTANRPGLTALSYRIGTHATFLETMLARLSSSDYPKLADLTTREANDPSIALLDAWAIVADVLTFYQECIINEGYLRTASERRSILELARLVGYKLRPGVSSSVYLAYTLEDSITEEVTISKGTRSQSLPGPGELPQSFEVSEDMKARAKWNNLRPRMTQPQTADSIQKGDGKNQRIYLKGINTNLKPNDPLLIDFGTGATPVFIRVKEVVPDPAAERTLVTLQVQASKPLPLPPSPPIDLIGALTLPPSVQLANSLRLERNLKTLFRGSSAELGSASTAISDDPSVVLRKTLAGGEASHAALKTFAPVLHETLATAAENARVTPENSIKIYALRVTASLFGNNAPKKPERLDDITRVLITKEWELSDMVQSEEVISDEDEEIFSSSVVYLDAGYDSVAPDSWIVIDTSPVIFDEKKTHHVQLPEPPILIAKVKNPKANIARAAYGISGKTTRIELIDPLNSGSQKQWLIVPSAQNVNPVAIVISRLSDDYQLIRQTMIYAQSEVLELAEEPRTASICGKEEEIIELDGMYEGLEVGRWVVISGERELEKTSGVLFSELGMLSSVAHDIQASVRILPGDKLHTFIKLARKLEYCFKRETVTIYGNVVKATHGETRLEVLGSGDGAKSLQSFTLRQPPLTYVSAANPSGVDSTLKVYINDIEWHETDALAGLAPTDRNFITKTDDEGKTALVFGNGREGARLPTGIENIRAAYRNGIGKQGNVNARQISLLTTRPLGVKAVINPLRASGGADKESRDQARKNAPLAVQALDRLVSVQDYEDFARIFAGIGKARATELSDGRRQVVHVTIAGADDIPIDKNGDLYRNMRQALLDNGDPFQALQLDIRELMLIVIEARISILPDYLWEPVVTQVRTALLYAFSFERRELGQDVLLSEVLSVMQTVRGVAYVDVDVLRGIPEKIADKSNPGQRRLLTPAEIAEQVSPALQVKGRKDINEPISRITVNLAAREAGTIRPAQLAFLTSEVPATLILNQIK